MATRTDIEAALKNCIDPELGIDIVNLGLLRDIQITNDKVTITMTLTTPGCPLIPYFHQQIIAMTKKAAEVGTVDVVVTFEPPWSPDDMSADAKRQLTMLRG